MTIQEYKKLKVGDWVVHKSHIKQRFGIIIKTGTDRFPKYHITIMWVLCDNGKRISWLILPIGLNILQK
jgi:hypothetical protein